MSQVLDTESNIRKLQQRRLNLKKSLLEASTAKQKARVLTLQAQLSVVNYELKEANRSLVNPVKEAPVVELDKERLWQAVLTVAPLFVLPEHKDHSLSVEKIFDIAELLVDELDERCSD